jgi:hypothetical protein
MRVRGLLTAAAAAALVCYLPARAQDPAQPGPASSPPAATAEQPTARPEQPQRRQQAPNLGSIDLGGISIEELEALLQPRTPPVEMPDRAKRDPWSVGILQPRNIRLETDPWGSASGAFLSTLMRRMDTPLASRWVHIALRNGLLADARAPRSVHPVDWVAERAWLLLRMGEADAARLLVSAVDVANFTPKMYQVALQSALASADPAAMCPIEGGLRRVEPRVTPLVETMCASLSGEPESAASQLDAIRRRGELSGIDLVLAQKVVGAGADTSRAVTVEWEPVNALNSWRFGLATATGMVPPERLMTAAPARVRAWQSRAPLLTAEQRLPSARIAAGTGVLSSQAMVDLHSIIYDSTDPEELPETEAWQLRLAFVGRDTQARLAAMRRLWDSGNSYLEREAARVTLARAATRIAPDTELQQDAPRLIASMLSGGFDREAARWAEAVGGMDDHYADQSWAMLALGAPSSEAMEISAGRVEAFIGRDTSAGKQRSALLVAGLTGLGRLDGATADRLNQRHNLGIGRRSRWTAMIDSAAGLGQGGTVRVLTGTGFQSRTFDQVPASHLYHSVAALRRTGQEFYARMIAAEALART